ncbi:flagellin [Nisaea acidiphila]|uniref:Flagellin n=1 Tax=Nisaea acidiphila TaxID=1862145 RepID=A0A9J7AT43_9PROT|nr:flagellin [Nisaea acidiphila]UUX50496.1 flagellin [Nisaea acidiphila]
MRIATLTTALRTQNTVLNLQDQMLRAQQQVSTGKVSQIYSGLTGDNARISIQLREEIQTKEAYVNTIEGVRTRTKIMEAALVGMQDLAEEMRAELIKQQEGKYDDTAPVLKQFADSAIDQLVSLLNSQSEGRYLFNGTSVATQPVIDATTLKTNAFAAITPLAVGNSATVIGDSATFFATDGNWNNVGGLPPGQTQPFAFDAAEGVRLEYGELASNDAFEELFEVFAVFADVDYAAGLDADYGALVTDGLTRVETAADQIGLMIASLGTTQGRMTDLEAQHKDDNTVLTKQLDGIENIDSFEAAAEFQLIQGQLQAAYQTTASIRNLSLANYL